MMEMELLHETKRYVKAHSVCIASRRCRPLLMRKRKRDKNFLFPTGNATFRYLSAPHGPRDLHNGRWYCGISATTDRVEPGALDCRVVEDPS